MVLEATEGGSEGAPEEARMPNLRWEINVRDRTGARAIMDIPRIPCPDMNLPAQVNFDSTTCQLHFNTFKTCFSNLNMIF